MLDEKPIDTPKHTAEAVEMEKLLSTLFRSLFKPRADDPLMELTNAQIRMMRALENGPESASVVGEHLLLSVSAVTQVANRLETLGLIERTETLSDRRVKPLALTHRGRSFLDLRNEARTARLEEILGCIDAKDHQRIRDVLHMLSEANKKCQAAEKAPHHTPRPSTNFDQNSTEELTTIARRMAERQRES